MRKSSECHGENEKVMKLLRVDMPKKQLLAVPEKERIFLIQTGVLLNELNALQKLMIFCTNKKATNPIVRGAENSQALFLGRVLAGKLWEGWRLLQKDFFGAKISETYDVKLSSVGQSSLKNIKQYFGSKNLTKFVRNNSAFHFSSKHINNMLEKAPESEVFEMFLAPQHGNCFYSISNVLTVFGILNFIDGSNTETAMKELLTQTIQVTRWFQDFLGDCLLVFSTFHPEFDTCDVEIPAPVPIDDVHIPYFVKNDSSSKQE